MKVNTHLIVTRYLSSTTFNRRPYVTLGCEYGGANKPRTKPEIDDEEEEVQVKRWGPYGTKKCGCPFKLKGKQMATCENWQLFVHDGRHNHAIGVYSHGHAQAAKLTDKQLIQTEQFKEPYATPAQKIYNVIVKIKKNRMQGRNTVEEVLCLSAQRGYTVFYRNYEDNNVLSDVVVAHPTSIEMMRTWSYILIMDMTYKTNKESDLMPVIDDVFSKAYHMLCGRHIDYNVLAKLTELTKDENVASQFVNVSWKKLLNEIDEQEYLRKLNAMKKKWQSRSDFLHYLFST
ncbi:hypothetical protein M9H77_29889 [Catharanthus roseus]|uniref:Uncharacterized protein n=1 Tax=Catharanthus roseus TaxID=4058 RepID=A0ACB9ZX10_CATRO|nr:hypothetical protein M9H77_29889 [Catharanthus roseus]